MIIIRYAQEELIVTDREPALWKRAHPRFIIGFKSIRSGSANVFPVLEITLVDVCYYFFRLLIDAVQARISSLFQALDQVRFKVLDVVFYRCFSFWLARRGRQDDRFVAVFQIGENCIEQQTIFRMPGYSCFEIVRDKVLRNCAIILQGMDNTGNKTREFFVGKNFCVNLTAETHGCCKHMDLPQLARNSVQQELRLVAYPVNVHPLAGDPFNRHFHLFLPEILPEEPPVQFIKL